MKKTDQNGQLLKSYFTLYLFQIEKIICEFGIVLDIPLVK